MLNLNSLAASPCVISFFLVFFNATSRSLSTWVITSRPSCIPKAWGCQDDISTLLKDDILILLPQLFLSGAILARLNRPPFLIRWLGPWRSVALGHTHRPFDRLEPHLLNIRPVPHLFLVAERGVEHAPFAEIAHPRYSEILVRAMDILFCAADRDRV